MHKMVIAVQIIQEKLRKYKYQYREFVADSVIQASGTVEFEDGLRTGVLLQDC